MERIQARVTREITEGCLVEELGYIQLYETDFNFFQLLFFGKNMHSLTSNGFLSKEQFSKKCSTAKDAKLDKTLPEDLRRNARHSMVVVTVDAEQCYDKVNHVIVALVLCAVIGNGGPIQMILTCLQTM